MDRKDYEEEIEEIQNQLYFTALRLFNCPLTPDENRTRGLDTVSKLYPEHKA